MGERKVHPKGHAHAQEAASEFHRHTEECWAPVLRDGKPHPLWRYCQVIYNPAHPEWSYYPLPEAER